jgi:hypothetical protein
MLGRQRIDAHAADRIDDPPVGIGMRMVRVDMTGMIVAGVIVSAATTFSAVRICNHDRTP